MFNRCFVYFYHCPECGRPFTRRKKKIGIVCCSLSCARKRHALSDPERDFWAFVDRSSPDSCWPWKGALNTYGYGRATWNGKRRPASRVALIIATDKDDPALEACHTCDVRYAPGNTSYRACCNPSHLVWGTHAENETDCAQKGRSARGARNGQSKLSAEHAANIIEEYGQLLWMLEEDIPNARSRGGTATKLLAASYGITPAHVWAIRTGKAWTVPE